MRVERYRIDKGFFTIKTEAIQVKVWEEYERVIGGQVDWTELVNMVIDAIMEAILRKVYQTLISLGSKVPSANKGTGTSFDKTQFDNILNTIKAYGSPVIVGTSKAVATIPLDSNASEQDKLDIRNKGYVGMYKGSAVIELPNSFEDETNTTPIFDDGFLFVIPSGQEKVVKVTMEGGFHVEDTRGQDWSMNYEGYQKVGVGLLAVNNIGIYENTSL
jgi:hypothetical protein